MTTLTEHCIRLGFPRANLRQSWNGFAPSGDVLHLSWAHEFDGDWLYLLDRNYKPTRYGAKERSRAVEMMRSGARTFALKSTEIAGFYERHNYERMKAFDPYHVYPCGDLREYSDGRVYCRVFAPITNHEIRTYGKRTAVV